MEPPNTPSSEPHGSRLQNRLQTHGRLVAFAIFALALLVRLIVGLEIRQSPIPELWRGAETDMGFFVAWAKLIVAGDWLTDEVLHPYFAWQRPIGTLAEWNAWYGGKTFHQAPLYPYLLAVILGLSGTGLWAVYVVQAVGSALTAVLLAGIGRRLFNPTVGLVAGVAAAIYGPLVFYDFVALRTSLAVLGAAATAWLLIRAGSDERWWAWAAAGGVMGLGFLLRPNAAAMLVLAVLGATVLMWRQWRRLVTACVCLVVGFAVCLIPLVARNVRVGVPPLSVSAVGASTFYLANAAGAPGTGWGMTKEFPQAMRRTKGRFSSLAREAAASHASIAGPIGLLVAKLRAVLHYFERTNNANPYYAERFSLLLRWGTVPFWLVLPLAMTGLVVTWPDRRRLIWLYVALLVPLVTMALFYQTARFRLPMVVALIPLAAAALEWMIARRGNLALAVPVTLAVCVVVRWPGSADPPRIQERDLQSGAHALSQVAWHDRALAEAREAVGRYPDSVSSRLTLIEAFRRAGRTDEAADACDQALRDLPDPPSLRVRRAAIYLDQNEPERAAAICQSLLDRNPKYVPALIALSRALAMPGPSQALARSRRLAGRAVRVAPQNAQAHRAWADALAAAGMQDQAVSALETGLSRIALTDPDRPDLLESLRKLKGS